MLDDKLLHIYIVLLLLSAVHRRCWQIQNKTVRNAISWEFYCCYPLSWCSIPNLCCKLPCWWSWKLQEVMILFLSSHSAHSPSIFWFSRLSHRLSYDSLLLVTIPSMHAMKHDDLLTIWWQWWHGWNYGFILAEMGGQSCRDQEAGKSPAPRWIPRLRPLFLESDQIHFLMVLVKQIDIFGTTKGRILLIRTRRTK